MFKQFAACIGNFERVLIDIIKSKPKIKNMQTQADKSLQWLTHWKKDYKTQSQAEEFGSPEILKDQETDLNNNQHYIKNTRKKKESIGF